MLFADGREATAASQHDSRRHSVLSLEEPGEVRLVGEARPLRNIGKNRVLGVEHPARALEAEVKEILMRGESHRLLKGAREMRGRQLNLVGEELHRQVRVDIGVYQLEDTTSGTRR